jgi:hypothetical protein
MTIQDLPVPATPPAKTPIEGCTLGPTLSEDATVTGGYPTPDRTQTAAACSVPLEFYSVEESRQSVNKTHHDSGYPATASSSTAHTASNEMQESVPISTPVVSRPPAKDASRLRSRSKSLEANTGLDVVWKSKLVEKFVVQEFAKQPVVYDGLSSTLLLGQRKQDQLDVCIKIIEKGRCADKIELQRARAELDIHRDIPHHRNVVPTLACEETADAFLLVTPFAPAGDLWDLIKYGQTICEIETRNCLAQVLEALRHIHGLGLIHGDMKPHNILLFKNDGRFVAQLCDFGLTERATLADGKIPFTGLRGTNGWYAPEQIEEVDYNSAVDLWGVGLMAFRMLGGYEPFYPATSFCEPVDFDEQYFCHVSSPCLDLVQQLLKLDPEHRATASIAAKHIWFVGNPPPEPTKEMLQNLEKYGAPPAKDLRFVALDELA